MTNDNKFIADILIVDDKPQNIKFLSDFLSDYNYQIRKAINGEMALNATRLLPPDLILLDINMPGLSGYEVCEQLKADPKTGSIPIIFLSAFSDTETKVKAFQYGGVDYITKPFQLEEVLARIQTQLNLKRLQSELEHRNKKLGKTVNLLQRTKTALTTSEAELRALFHAMTELVLVLDSQGRYLKIATPNHELIYQSPQLAVGKTLHESLPQAQADLVYSTIQNVLERQETIEVEYSLQLENGRIDFSAKISPLSQDSVIAVMRDITDRKRREEALQLIVEGTATKTGREFFDACVRQLAEILAARYAFVTECLDFKKKRVRTLAFWQDEKFVKNIEYDLLGTPCQEVIQNNKYSCYSDNIIAHFPDDQDLVDLKAESYAGIPLTDSMGNVIGHIAVLDTQPMLKDETRELVLKIFAARAGAELERQITDIALKKSQERSEELLLNILPAPIVERLKKEKTAIAEQFADVTILFADIVGFTPLSAKISPTEMVNLLNEIFSVFDQLTEQHGLEKIKTIGDAYMVVGGLPVYKANHAQAVAQMALDMRDAIARFQESYGEQLQIRIGVNRGSVVAGVIGTKKFIYDLWGDAVNVASRMESLSLPGKIQVTEATYTCLKEQYRFEQRGKIAVKGKGEMTTYWLLESLTKNPPLPNPVV
ncbi:adenylate/guanylate cyclase domain-containing protein [Coleofasciculus sp. E2-BRE-01]|uniref:adenylate/guanylate cyclase domain-containing protein n=1 Tax=Coleofasciculus sp. E2-BRE-01 TaxID=3069524 RepID=UPI0032FA4FA0